MRLLIERQNHWTLELTSYHESGPGTSRPGAQPSATPLVIATTLPGGSESKGHFHLPKADSPQQRREPAQDDYSKPSHTRSIRKKIFGKMSLHLSRWHPSCRPNLQQPRQHEDLYSSTHLQELQATPAELAGSQIAWELSGDPNDTPASNRRGDNAAFQTPNQVQSHRGLSETTPYPTRGNTMPLVNPRPRIRINVARQPTTQSDARHSFARDAVSPNVSPVSADHWHVNTVQRIRYIDEQRNSSTPHGFFPSHPMVSPLQPFASPGGIVSPADRMPTYSAASSPTVVCRGSNAMSFGDAHSDFPTPAYGPAVLASPAIYGTCTPYEGPYDHSQNPSDTQYYSPPQGLGRTPTNFSPLTSPTGPGIMSTAGMTFHSFGVSRAWEQSSLLAQHPTMAEAYPINSQENRDHNVSSLSGPSEALPKYSPVTGKSQTMSESAASPIGKNQPSIPDIIPPKGKGRRGQHTSASSTTAPTEPPPNDIGTLLCAPFFPTPSPLPCKFCEQVFTGVYRKGNRKRHERQKHAASVGLHPCRVPQCDKAYKRTDALRKHEWKTHRIGPRPERRREIRIYMPNAPEPVEHQLLESPDVPYP